MAARLVTIARTDGAVGDTVGRQVADALGFQYIDYGVIERYGKRTIHLEAGHIADDTPDSGGAL